jgi:hypothetical protein
VLENNKTKTIETDQFARLLCRGLVAAGLTAALFNVDEAVAQAQSTEVTFTLEPAPLVLPIGGDASAIEALNSSRIHQLSVVVLGEVQIVSLY